MDGASDEYRAARQSPVEAEIALRDRAERVADQRRRLPPGPTLPEYRMHEGCADLSLDGPTSAVALFDRFGRHDHLVADHLMFQPAVVIIANAPTASPGCASGPFGQWGCPSGPFA